MRGLVRNRVQIVCEYYLWLTRNTPGPNTVGNVFICLVTAIILAVTELFPWNAGLIFAGAFESNIRAGDVCLIKAQLNVKGIWNLRKLHKWTPRTIIQAQFYALRWVLITPISTMINPITEENVRKALSSILTHELPRPASHHSYVEPQRIFITEANKIYLGKMQWERFRWKPTWQTPSHLPALHCIFITSIKAVVLTVAPLLP